MPGYAPTCCGRVVLDRTNDNTGIWICLACAQEFSALQ
jgi:ribosomal protein L37AE/L43A